MNTPYPKFPTLESFIEHCLDAGANGTGGPRTEFVVTANEEPIGPEAGAAMMTVLTIAPRNFEYMEQRFAFDLTGQGGVLMNDAVDSKRDFLLTAAKSEAAATAALAEQTAGTVSTGAVQ